MVSIKRNKNDGVSLVGVLVAVVISSIVIMALITIFITVKDRYNLYKDKTTAEVKQLLVKSILYDFVKDVGFACKFGYSEQVHHDRTNDSLDGFFTDASALRVGNLPLTTSNHLPEQLEAGCSEKCYQANTDYIMIKKEEDHTFLIGTNALDTTLNVVSADGIESGDYLFLCGKNNINMVRANSVNLGTNTIELSQAPTASVYYPGDYLGEYSFEVLYVGNAGEQDENGQDIFALYIYMKSDNTQGESFELVRGVESLQIERITSISNGNISWDRVSSDVDLQDSNDTAIRVSFSIDGNRYHKIINL
ncbi:photosystem I protein M (PsaM) [Candidatus Francisella endociliophora]|uniref:Photosystem I protein M (PsaM) n=1 Tax=Candidatus Francisella endociliophora TaxID=653937 RepID=A0A097EQP1_9GAMM|nr:prepilin-type N-terminal cleavage/methylation domain-containing protein [Francisella sp. FSC1006]AIT09885.1 photosystem I protein M (PsaM) [Francisella sp. FSC1006]